MHKQILLDKTELRVDLNLGGLPPKESDVEPVVQERDLTQWRSEWVGELGLTPPGTFHSSSPHLYLLLSFGAGTPNWWRFDAAPLR